jgi:hypothetical protein
MQKSFILVVASALLDTFDKVSNSAEVIRHLLRSSVDEFESQWALNNMRCLTEGAETGLDCVNWPDLKLLSKDKHYFNYPIEIIPVSPNYCFICCPIDSKTFPHKNNNLYWTNYPECMDSKDIVWNANPTLNLIIATDGMHKTRIK